MIPRRQYSLAMLMDVVTLAAMFVYMMRVAAPLMDESIKHLHRYQFERALSSKFDFALQKQKTRNDNMFTVVIYDRSQWDGQ